MESGAVLWVVVVCGGVFRFAFGVPSLLKTARPSRG